MQTSTLTAEGKMIAAAEVADTYGSDSDLYDHVFLFKNDGGYELLVVGRRERYGEDGLLQRAAVSVDLTPASSPAVLQEIVEARWSATSAVWWQLLDRGREHDQLLHELWVPERMRRDLDQSSVYDKTLALRIGYFGGHELAAPGRAEDRWQDRAVGAVGELLQERGWHVRPGPELSPNVQPGGILSSPRVPARRGLRVKAMAAEGKPTDRKPRGPEGAEERELPQSRPERLDAGSGCAT